MPRKTRPKKTGQKGKHHKRKKRWHHGRGERSRWNRAVKRAFRRDVE